MFYDVNQHLLTRGSPTIAWQRWCSRPLHPRRQLAPLLCGHPTAWLLYKHVEFRPSVRPVRAYNLRTETPRKFKSFPKHGSIGRHWSPALISVSIAPCLQPDGNLNCEATTGLLRSRRPYGCYFPDFADIHCAHSRRDVQAELSWKWMLDGWLHTDIDMVYPPTDNTHPSRCTDLAKHYCRQGVMYTWNDASCLIGCWSEKAAATVDKYAGTKPPDASYNEELQ